jgi:plasmid maintenance system killer protein
LKAPRDEGERPAAVKPPTLEGMDFRAVLVKVARRKLPYLNAVGDLGDLRSPPGNRLEALVGDCEGQCSIRSNDQIRVFFVWTSASSTSSLSFLCVLGRTPAGLDLGESYSVIFVRPN